ncbi:hypothetical protein [Aquimarina litoralis]|uniref:hypothetical protein n=1 Tax=Aquimarina litoralis TaxID=584605 RepID=UPI001C57B247|nr:hypothetical protein [Aquimarina litoralis]MBW1297965.1 hypothetical protein [Aquimarina litoralis]
MKQIKKLTGAKPLSKSQQKDVHGGILILEKPGNVRRRCNPALSCCYHNGTTWVQGPPCF